LRGELARILATFFRLRCGLFRRIARQQHIGAGLLALQHVADWNQRDDGIVLDVGHVHRARPGERALIVLELGRVPVIHRRLVDDAAFDLREKTVADAHHLDLQVRDVDGGDGHAVRIVARQDDAAGKAHQCGLVAQLDGHRLRDSELFSGGRGEPTPQRDTVGLVEGQPADAQALIERARDDARLRVDHEIIFVMGASAHIEIAGEDEAGLRVALAGVDLQPVKREFRRGGHLAGRHCGRNRRGKSAAQPREEAAIRRTVSGAQIVEDSDGEDRNDEDRPADQKNPPHSFPSARAPRCHAC